MDIVMAVLLFFGAVVAFGIVIPLIYFLEIIQELIRHD